MAIAKVFSNGAVYNGRGTVSIGADKSVPWVSGQVFHDDSSREQVLQPSGLETDTNISGRYYYHGGPGGSSNWEH